MADLREVVGAILRDITEARAQADAASRDMALMYAKDPILRAFTIPRTEIRDLKLDLKIAVRGLEESSDDQMARDARMDEVVRKMVRALPFPIDEQTFRTLRALATPIISREAIFRVLEPVVKQAASKEAETRPRNERPEILKKLISEWSESVKIFADQFMLRVKEVLAAPSQKTIGVEVVTTELKDIPPHMISTISITLDVNGIVPTDREES